MIILFKGEPKSTQTIYRASCKGRFPTTYMTALGKSVKEGYQWDAKMQWKGNTVIIKPISMSIWFYFKTKRRRDLDNHNKLILDAMSGIVYEDDSQIDELHIYRRYDKARPHIKVEIDEL